MEPALTAVVPDIAPGVAGVAGCVLIVAEVTVALIQPFTSLTRTA